MDEETRGVVREHPLTRKRRKKIKRVTSIVLVERKERLVMGIMQRDKCKLDVPHRRAEGWEEKGKTGNRKWIACSCAAWLALCS